MKRLALALALLCLPALALAQSDGRKVALFVLNGGTASNGEKTWLNTASGTSTASWSTTLTHLAVRQALEQMGVPYDEILLPDSSGGWRTQTSRDATGRAAGIADSTWFRTQGYMGAIVCFRRILGASGTGLEPIKFFQNNVAAQRGTQEASPLGGNWGIPVIAFYMDNRSFATHKYWCGLKDAAPGTYAASESLSTGQMRATWVSEGDSLTIYNSYKILREPSQEDSVTVIIAAGDTTDGTGLDIRAWKWKNSTYYYPCAFNGQNYESVLLGIAKLFDEAGYKPRRKLNLHYTNDHIFPTSTYYTAATDSAMNYFRRNGWRFKGGVNFWSTETHPDTTLKALWYGYRDLYAPLPHVHDDFAMASTKWNMEAADYDSALYAARWNAMNRAIFDTTWVPNGAVRRPVGYERTLEIPLDNIKHPLLWVFAQDGIGWLRAPGSDSLGWSWASVNSKDKVVSGRALGPSSRVYLHNRPRPWQDPGTKRIIWIHDMLSYPGSADTSWAGATGNLVWDGTRAYGDGAANRFTGYVSRALLWNMDLYMHSQDNLKGQWLGMSYLYRRLSYLMGKWDNIATMQPVYYDKVPRRHNTAWSTTGRTAWR